MKFIQLLPVLSCLLLSVAPALARDFRPATHMEHLPAGDSSVKECYVIQTTAGVGYTVQSSEDLTTWTAEDSFYGLGGEYVVTMRESTPAPPLPPGTPPAVRPPPAKNVSLRMDRASGTAGGTVICWASLDDGGPRKVRIVGEMVSGWNAIPFYAERFGDFDFFIMHQLPTIAPPVENSFLGEKDTAMLASLEENLATMNQQVINSVARARNGPLPGPAAPGSKRFWRVLVNPEVDTDSDGSPDWSEFEIAARVAAGTADGTGVLVPGVTPDPFDSDTNGDGIPDGDQLDGDRDGTADRTDPDSSDNTAFFPLGPIPRYALFPIQTDTLPSTLQPHRLRQINDKGRVLYESATWIAGVWTKLADPSNDSTGGAYAINDNDVIIGRGGYQQEAGLEGATQIVYYWNSPQAVPLPVKQFTDVNQAHAADFAHRYLSNYEVARKPLLSNDGTFTGRTCKWIDLGDGTFAEEFIHFSNWTLPTGSSNLSTQGQVTDGMRFHQSPNLSWDFKGDSPPQGKVFAPNPLPDLPFQPLQVYATPQGILALPEKDEAGTPKLFTNGAWKDAPLYRHATDMSDDGIAIGRSHGNLTAPILLNGKWVGISRCAPGLTGIWTEANVRLTDTTARGWILVQQAPGTTNDRAVMLPIKIDGVDPDVVPPNSSPSPGAPPYNPPEFLSGGVDHTSMTADRGTGYVPQIWIMAPSGESKQVRFQSPLNASSKLRLLSNFNLEFAPTEIKTNDLILQVKALATSGQYTPALKLGGTVDSISSPLMIKIMKKRTLKLAVHPVALKRAGEDAIYPFRIPSNSVEDRNDFKQKLTVYLDKVYGMQVNLFFDINVMPAVEVDFDTVAPVGVTEITSGPTFTPEMTIACTNPQWPLNLADIDIWIVGGTSLAEGSRAYAGMKIGGQIENQPTRQVPYIIVNGSSSVGGVIAHEMGHIFMGQGHPDVKEQNYFARLEGISQEGRLMKSMFTGNSSCQLIKKEWDQIEVWLKRWDNK
jgi:hypothetical protein